MFVTITKMNVEIVLQAIITWFHLGCEFDKCLTNISNSHAFCTHKNN